MRIYLNIAWVFTLIALLASIAFAQNAGKISAPEGVMFEFGNIDIQAGKVRHSFHLKNSGDGVLLLKGAFTSCLCTQVVYEFYDGTKSDFFGAKKPGKWEREIAPGERFNAILIFDPLAHGPEGVGPFRRDAYLITTSPHDDEISLNLPMLRDDDTATRLHISGTVFPEGKVPEGSTDLRYPHIINDFHFEASEYDFGVLQQSWSMAKHKLRFIYKGKEPVEVTGTPTSCGCTRASISKKTLNPGDKGFILLEFDPNLHEEPKGRFFKTVMIETDPPQLKRAELLVWAEINLDLGPEHYKQKSH